MIWTKRKLRSIIIIMKMIVRQKWTKDEKKMDFHSVWLTIGYAFIAFTPWRGQTNSEKNALLQVFYANYHFKLAMKCTGCSPSHPLFGYSCQHLRSLLCFRWKKLLVSNRELAAFLSEGHLFFRKEVSGAGWPAEKTVPDADPEQNPNPDRVWK